MLLRIIFNAESGKLNYIGTASVSWYSLGSRIGRVVETTSKQQGYESIPAVRLPPSPPHCCNISAVAGLLQLPVASHEHQPPGQRYALLCS